METDISDDRKFQEDNWRSIKTFIYNVLLKLEEPSIICCLEDLLSVNLIRGKNILVSEILKLQQIKDNASCFVSLIALLSEVIPDIGPLLARSSASMFIENYKYNNLPKTLAMASILCHLVNYEVIHEILIFQLIHLLLERPEEKGITITCYMLKLCGKTLMEINKINHDNIYEKLRIFLQEQRVSKVACLSIEQALSLRRLNYKDALNLLKLPDHCTNIETVILDLNDQLSMYSKELDLFEYDPHFFETEEHFQNIRSALLSQYCSEKQESYEKVVDMTEKDDLEFKKKIYLILKGCLSADEAAHKILKLHPGMIEKDKIVNIIMQSCYQETTYSKYYGIIAEKLSRFHKSWKVAFEKLFLDSYKTIDNFENSQLRIVGRFWGHLLSTKCIEFSSLSCVHMNEKETTMHGRIFIKFIFQELVEALGIDELKRILETSEIQKRLHNLFPMSVQDHMIYSINYFTAIGCGALTDVMRSQLLSLENKGTSKSKIEDPTNKLRKDDKSSITERCRRELNRSIDSIKTRNRSVTPPFVARNYSRSLNHRDKRLSRSRSRSP